MVENPLNLDFHRGRRAPHAIFGNGPHKCPGANLAHHEIRITLEERLARIPDFELEPGTGDHDRGRERSAIAAAALGQGTMRLTVGANRRALQPRVP